MRYFTNELWCKSNSENPAERDAADLEWINNIEAYKAYLHSIEKKIPRSTWNAIYEITEVVSLHDFDIMNISFCSEPASKRTCHLQLTDGVTNVDLIMQGVTRLCVEAELSKGDELMGLRWGYCEFFYKKPQIELSILCDSGHIWQFEFSSLSIEKSTEEMPKNKRRGIIKGKSKTLSRFFSK